MVQNGVMDERFVKNFVMDAESDPNVVVDLTIFKNWWMDYSSTK